MQPERLDFGVPIEVCTWEARTEKGKLENYENGELVMEEDYSFSLID